MNRKEWLENLINKNNFTIGAEVGVQGGKTFKYLIKQMPDLKLYGIDVWAVDKNVRWDGTTNEQLIELPKNSNQIELENWIQKQGFSDRAILIRSFSDQCLDQFEDQSLDFVFIDASHQYPDVLKDIKLWSEKVRIGGYITGHDIDMGGVKQAVTESFEDYQITGHDNVWSVRKEENESKIN
jgi:hypothetical protein